MKLAAEVQDEHCGSEAHAPLPTQVPEDFLNAFAPALPRSFLNDYEGSSSALDVKSEVLSGSSGSQPGSRPSSAGSRPYSHYESCSSSSLSPPVSPLRPGSTGPSHPPRLEISTLSADSPTRAPSITSSSVFQNPQFATAAIRAAYDASVRRKKSFHRASWNPTSAEFSGITGQRSPRSTFTSPLSPPSASSTNVISPLTPASAPNAETVFQPVSSC